MRRRRGQVLVGVVLLLMILSILVPAMVLYTQREATWTAKESRNTTAFHLAESGVEKGFLVLSLSTLTWRNLQDGIQITDFKFDRSFSDVPGGNYTVSITSGPDTEQATVISVGRDSARKETRALKVIYANATLGGIAIFSAAGVQVGNGVTVHWGAIVSPQDIDMGSSPPSYPSVYSSGAIDPFDSDPAPANCDSPSCCRWHSYYTNIPPEPVIDINFYKSSAQATSTYYATAQSWSTYDYSGGGTVFVDNNLTLDSPGLDIVGSLVVTGNVTTNSGNWGKGTRSPILPRDAWKQYCLDWATYQPFDSGEPAAFPGVNSTYLAAAGQTPGITPNGKFAVSGLMYVQGNFSVGGGGGSSYVHGVMYVLGSSTMTSSSGVTVYYDKSASQNIQTTKVVLTRQSWQDAPRYVWPSGLP